MKAKTAKKSANDGIPLEEDVRIVAGTLRGAKECKMGLAKRFDKVEDAIAYLRELDEKMQKLSQKIATRHSMSISDAVLAARAEEDDKL